MAVQYANGKIVTNGLILALDATDKNSYPGNGTTWYDLSGNNAHGTINGSVAFVNDGPKSYFNFATAGDGNYISSTISQNYLDVTIVFQPDFTRSQASGISGLIADTPNSVSQDNSLRFGNVNGTGPWNISNPGDQNNWTSGTATTYYRNGTVSNTLVSGWNIFGGYRTNQGVNFPVNFAYHLGASGYPGRGFQGKLVSVYMYNRQLSAEEQLQNYNALKSRFNIN
jgi:hypothetical protein